MDVDGYWEQDKAKPNVLLAVVTRLTGLIDDASTTDTYIDLVIAKLREEYVDIKTGTDEETRKAWRVYLIDPRHAWTGSVKLLSGVWFAIVLRLVYMWVQSSQIREQEMYNSWITQLMDFVSGLVKDLKAVVPPDKYEIVVADYRQFRGKVVGKMQELDKVQVNNRLNAYSFMRMWDMMDTIMKNKTCKKLSGEDVPFCRKAELARLQRFRQRMEEALTFQTVPPGGTFKETVRVSLLPVQHHLFQIETYYTLKDPIMEFQRLTDNQKFLRVKLLQKLFEREALSELHRMLLIVEEDTKFILSRVQRAAPLIPRTVKTVNERLGNIEWQLQRVWQEEFELPPTATDFVGGSGGDQSGGGIEELVSMEKPGSISMAPPSLTSDSKGKLIVEDLAVATVTRDIVAARSRVRHVQQLVRGNIRMIAATAVAHESAMNSFVTDNVGPRLDNVVESLDTNIAQYMRIETSYDDDTQLLRTERSIQKDALSRATIGLGTVIRRKLEDSSAGVFYGLKGARLIGQVGAIYVAQKVFSERYVSMMYVDGKTQPPDLSYMLWLFLGIDATLQLMVLLIIVLLSYARKNVKNSFAIDDEFLMSYLVEYFITTSIITTFGLLLGKLMQKKVYFDYPAKGSVVESAYRDIMIGICVVMCIIPFFILFD